MSAAAIRGLGDVVTEARALAVTLREVERERWESSAGEDRSFTTKVKRPPGAAPSDPTFDTTVDVRRWRLSAACAAAERELEGATQVLRRVHAGITAALPPATTTADTPVSTEAGPPSASTVTTAG